MNRIKELRKSKNVTLQEVSEKTGISITSLSFYEKGQRNPKIETWQKLADYFDVPVSYLQGITDDEVKKNTEDIFYMVSVVLDAYRKVLSEEEAIVLTNGKKIAGKDKDNVLLGFEFAEQAINKYKNFVYLFSSNMDKEQMLKLMTKIFKEDDNDD
ncbi:helix-turn-helix transcriptional regulator [Ligilactobacillus murinus]|nr:helix-turn-helix transcriptional regulator [Ligilactobacillus murinus]